jgi:hypothetical protein
MTKGTYAAGTAVPVAQSRAEIESTLSRYGADEFGFAQSASTGVVMFVFAGRQYRISAPMPDRDDRDIRLTPTGRTRTSNQRVEVLEAERRQRWRALLLIIKGKLQAVETGIVSWEQEWGTYTVLPDGRTAGDYLDSAISEAYESGQVPSLVPPPPRKELE